jgi:hypothetical protein
MTAPWIGEPRPGEVPLLYRGVYRIRSRNLQYGVYDSGRPAGGGFIGIRTKFGERFLATEYDQHTAAAAEYLGMLPDGIAAAQYEPGGPTCQACGKPARWTGPPGPAPWECDSGCADVTAVHAPVNQALFDYLDRLEGR